MESLAVYRKIPKKKVRNNQYFNYNTQSKTQMTNDEIAPREQSKLGPFNDTTGSTNEINSSGVFGKSQIDSLIKV